MKKNQGKTRRFKRYVSAVQSVMKNELSTLEHIPEAVEENRDLLWDIKEMLENALIGAYLAPPPKTFLLAVLDERFPLQEHKHALATLKAVWTHESELRTILSSVSPIIRELFIASLREEIAAASVADHDTTELKADAS